MESEASEEERKAVTDAVAAGVVPPAPGSRAPMTPGITTAAPMTPAPMTNTLTPRQKRAAEGGEQEEPELKTFGAETSPRRGREKRENEDVPEEEDEKKQKIEEGETSMLSGIEKGGQQKAMSILWHHHRARSQDYIHHNMQEYNILKLVVMKRWMMD